LFAWSWYDSVFSVGVDTSGNTIGSRSKIAPHTPWDGARYSAIAFDGSNYLAAWYSWSNTTGDTILLAGRINPQGIPLDSSGIFISQWAIIELDRYRGYERDYDIPIAVAFDGTNFLIVWEDIRNDGTGDNTDIYGARITPDGTVLDTFGIPISTNARNQLNPDVVFDGKNFLVVWDDYRDNLSDIYGTEVTTDGIVLDPGGVLISDGAYPNRFPELAKVGDGRSLVVYQSLRPTPYGSDRIYGRLFESSVGVEEDKSFPISQFKLFQNIPNPFMGSTTLSYNLPTSNFISLKIYDISGRLVKVIEEGKKKAGFYNLKWDGRDDKKRTLPSGFYFLRFTVDDLSYSETKKLLLIR
jgi:hypothetical protein